MEQVRSGMHGFGLADRANGCNVMEANTMTEWVTTVATVMTAKWAEETETRFPWPGRQTQPVCMFDEDDEDDDDLDDDLEDDDYLDDEDDNFFDDDDDEDSYYDDDDEDEDEDEYFAREDE